MPRYLLLNCAPMDQWAPEDVEAHGSWTPAAAARRRREEPMYAEPLPAATEEGDDTLLLLFCCCHPDLAPASQVALTLRAVGGLTTREIADASTCRRRRWRGGSAAPSAP